MESADAGVRHLNALAREARFTGSASAARAREYCRGELERLGFAVSEEPFGYSALPGRLGGPIAGAWGAVATLGAASIGSRGHQESAGLFALGMAVALVVAGMWIARRGVLALPVLRRRGVNLCALRGAGEPRLWLVAHVDSKSQLVPMLVRVGSVTLLAVAWIAELLFGLLAPLVRLPEAAWIPLGVVGAFGALGVMLTLVGDDSAGAVDDASGVATVLAASEMVPREHPLGVLITDAEEMGLAGARAVARGGSRARAGIVLNVDGVDDDGSLRLMHGSRRPSRVIAAMRDGAEREGEALIVHRILPGVLVDAIAFADAGWEAVTLSRGTARTLRRVHTRADSLEEMTGCGIAGAARVLARAATELI